MITQALIANGAKVYITGRRQEVLENTVKTYNTGPGSLHALPGDISTKEGAIQLAKDLSAKESNGIHLLVNNAGIARDDNTKFCMYPSILTHEESDTYFLLTHFSCQRTARGYRRRCHQQALPAFRRLPMGRNIQDERYWPVLYGDGYASSARQGQRCHTWLHLTSR